MSGTASARAEKSDSIICPSPSRSNTSNQLFQRDSLAMVSGDKLESGEGKNQVRINREDSKRQVKLPPHSPRKSVMIT